jgi:hypothetical protein
MNVLKKYILDAWLGATDKVPKYCLLEYIPKRKTYKCTALNNRNGSYIFITPRHITHEIDRCNSLHKFYTYDTLGELQQNHFEVFL